jgi:acetyl esterase/lipase
MATLNPRALALKAILALPGPMLRALSGGAAVYVGGRTLDPRLQFIAAQGRAAPPLSSLAPEVARLHTAAGFGVLRGAPEPGVTITPLKVPGGGGLIDARVYRPAILALDAPLLIFAHQGGGVIGDLDTTENFCALFAATAGWPVVSIDYRLAPEHRFPAALEDMLAACRWGREAAAGFGAAPGRIAVGGDSIGGHLAASACQALRRAGEPQPALQLLIYPALDAAGEQPSMALYGQSWPLTAADMAWFMGHYLGPEDSPENPLLSPLREPDLAGLAPAVIAGAGFDPLVDQGEAYARALIAAGGRAVYRCYDSLAHAFTAFIDIVPAARAACRQIAELARDTAANDKP